MLILTTRWHRSSSKWLGEGRLYSKHSLYLSRKVIDCIVIAWVGLTPSHKLYNLLPHLARLNFKKQNLTKKEHFRTCCQNDTVGHHPQRCVQLGRPSCLLRKDSRLHSYLRGRTWTPQLFNLLPHPWGQLFLQVIVEICPSNCKTK